MPTEALRPLLMARRKILLGSVSTSPAVRLAVASHSIRSSSASAGRRCVVRQGLPALRRGARFYSTPSSGDGASRPSSSSPSSSPKPTPPSSKADDKSSSSSDPSSSRSNDPESDRTSSSDSTSATSTPLSTLSSRFATSMDNLQSRLLTASQRLNDLTGYTAIERIKAHNDLLEGKLSVAQSRLEAARAAYKSSNASRASTQRETTALLARRDTWSPADLERFTALYRADHGLESECAAAATELTEAEADEQRLSQAVTQGMLRRYHEEQIWSDRIRRQSTWGTWGLMGVNVVLFLVLQFVAEPWRRRRLVNGVVEREREVLEDVKLELRSVGEALARSGAPAGMEVDVLGGEMAEAIAIEGSTMESAAPSIPVAEEVRISPSWTWGEAMSDPARWKGALIDLYSERRIDLTMRDASLIALEGAIAGGAIVAGIAAFWLRRA